MGPGTPPHSRTPVRLTRPRAARIADVGPRTAGPAAKMGGGRSDNPQSEIHNPQCHTGSGAQPYCCDAWTAYSFPRSLRGNSMHRVAPGRRCIWRRRRTGQPAEWQSLFFAGRGTSAGAPQHHPLRLRAGARSRSPWWCGPGPALRRNNAPLYIYRSIGAKRGSGARSIGRPFFAPCRNAFTNRHLNL